MEYVIFVKMEKQSEIYPNFETALFFTIILVTIVTIHILTPTHYR